jgi:hypothetical protein
MFPVGCNTGIELVSRHLAKTPDFPLTGRLTPPLVLHSPCFHLANTITVLRIIFIIVCDQVINPRRASLRLNEPPQIPTHQEAKISIRHKRAKAASPNMSVGEALSEFFHYTWSIIWTVVVAFYDLVVVYATLAVCAVSLYALVYAVIYLLPVLLGLVCKACETFVLFIGRLVTTFFDAMTTVARGLSAIPRGVGSLLIQLSESFIGAVSSPANAIRCLFTYPHREPTPLPGGAERQSIEEYQDSKSPLLQAERLSGGYMTV